MFRNRKFLLLSFKLITHLSCKIDTSLSISLIIFYILRINYQLMNANIELIEHTTGSNTKHYVLKEGFGIE